METAGADKKAYKKRFVIPGFTTLDRYILVKYLTTFFFAISLLLAITVVFDISEKIDDFIDSEATILEIVFDYYLNFVLFFAVVFCPLFTFIAVIFFTSKLAANSEIVAILSSGVSFYRMLWPFLIGAVMIFVLDYYAVNYWVPRANQKMIDFENTYIKSKHHFGGKNIHIQLDEENFVYLEKYNVQDSAGYKFALSRIQNNELVFKITARKIKWKTEEGKWEIMGFMVRKNNGLEESLNEGTSMDTVLNFSPADFSRKIQTLPAMNTTELEAFIDQERLKGAKDVVYYEIELHKRMAFPFATIVLTFIGVAMASRKTRGGLGLHLAFGIALGFGYIVFQQFSQTFSTNADLPAFWGVWIPNIIFGVLAVVLIRDAPK